MPKLGYKTITITDELYDDLKQKYAKEKSYWAKRGIRSFSAFVAYRLSEMLEADT